MSTCFLFQEDVASTKISRYGTASGFSKATTKEVLKGFQHKPITKICNGLNGLSQSISRKIEHKFGLADMRCLFVTTLTLQSSLALVYPCCQREVRELVSLKRSQLTPALMNLSLSPSSSITGTGCSVGMWTVHTEQPNVSQLSHLQLTASFVCAAHLEGAWPALFSG